MRKSIYIVAVLALLGMSISGCTKPVSTSSSTTSNNGQTSTSASASSSSSSSSASSSSNSSNSASSTNSSSSSSSSSEQTSFTVTWENWDLSVLETDNDVKKGDYATYNGAQPTKAEDAQYTYAFAGWDPAFAPIVADTTYVAKYKTSLSKSYTITWENYNGDILEVDNDVLYGVIPTYDGATPTKESTVDLAFTFSNWSPAIQPVSGDTTYTAQYDSKTRQYTVSFKNDDGTVLQTGLWDYNTTPVYSGATPTKASTVAATYTFSGWSPAIAAVTHDVTYTAAYDAASVFYTITFKDWDGTVLQSTTVQYGDTAKYLLTNEPSRAWTNTRTYTFTGWDHELATVTHDDVYIAQYLEEVRKYSIRFYDSDGQTLLQSDSLEYGVMPVFNGTTPTKANTAEFTYAFKGWDHDIVAASADAIYVAVYISTTNIYTVRFLNWDGTVLQQSRLEYGATPYYNKLDPTKATDVGYTYAFIGWNNSISPVTGDTDYKAIFEATARSYTITFQNYDGTVLSSASWDYGMTPSYDGATPIKESTDPSKRYTFSGWDTEISTVAGDHTYTAQFTTEDIYYTITFKNYDGTILETDKVLGGTTPSCSVTPTKAEDISYHVYTFSTWSPTISSALADATYTAQFTASEQKLYTATMNTNTNKVSSYTFNWNGSSATYTAKGQTWSSTSASGTDTEGLSSYTYSFYTDSGNLADQQQTVTPQTNTFFTISNLGGANNMNVDFISHFTNLSNASLNFIYTNISNYKPIFGIYTSSEADPTYRSLMNSTNLLSSGNSSYTKEGTSGVGAFNVTGLTNVKTICFSFHISINAAAAGALTLLFSQASFSFNYPVA